MGVIRIIFLGILPFLSGSLYLSLRLGEKLAISCRSTGRNFGMFYNYLKVVLNFFKPKASQTGEVIQMVRSINQQSHAFTRELHSNLLNSKKDLEFILPGIKDEISKNTDENKQLKEELDTKINGAKILELSILERRNIVSKKRHDSMKNDSFYN